MKTDTGSSGLKCRTTVDFFTLNTVFEKYCAKQNGIVYACFVGFQKVYDSVWHDALFKAYES